MELPFVADLMTRALVMLHWLEWYPVEVKENRYGYSDSPFMIVGGNITLYQDNVEVTRQKTITSPAETKMVPGWIVDIATETPASRWEPGDVDIKIVHTSESVLSCIDFICGLCFDDLKSGNFRYLEYQIEMEAKKTS